MQDRPRPGGRHPRGGLHSARLVTPYPFSFRSRPLAHRPRLACYAWHARRSGFSPHRRRLAAASGWVPHYHRHKKIFLDEFCHASHLSQPWSRVPFASRPQIRGAAEAGAPCHPAGDVVPRRVVDAAVGDADASVLKPALQLGGRAARVLQRQQFEGVPVEARNRVAAWRSLSRSAAPTVPVPAPDRPRRAVWGYRERLHGFLLCVASLSPDIAAGMV